MNFVAISFNNLHVVSVYISPNVTFNDFSAFIDDLTDFCALYSDKMIVCGDFNAHAISWRSPSTDPRGRLVEEWAAQLDLRLANVGNCPTCVRSQGSSIIDLTWVSPGLLRGVREWRVQDILSLSDHLYITFSVSEVPAPRRADPVFSRPRWNFKKADLELG